MTIYQPQAITLRDMCTAALQESGYLGVGQTALADDVTIAWSRCQFMLNEWERKRWLVYVLQTLDVVSTGAEYYTIGPGGDLDTGSDSVRPVRIESAFLRQPAFPSQQPVDYPLQVLNSREDYNKIPLKSMVSFTGAIFLQTDWPLGKIFPYPVPSAGIYSIYVTVMSQLQSTFADLDVVLNFPYEYYAAIMYNLAIRLRSRYQIGSYPGDMLPTLAAEALKTIRGANVQIAQLTIPKMNNSNDYNIFSDRFR